MKRGVVWAILLAVAGIFGVSGAHAVSFDSTNFSINGSIGDSIAGSQSSANYQMYSSGGQSIAGEASSSSYRLGLGYIPKLEKSLQLSTQSVGLEAYLALDEESGSIAYDSSTNLRNASFDGTPAVTSGKVGNSRLFNGVDQGATIPDFDISGTITYSAWFYSTSSNQTSKIIAKNSSTTDAQAILGLTNGRLFSLTTAGGTGDFVYGPQLDTNKWYYAAVTYDGSAARLYLDGIERSSKPASGAIANNNFPWGIGRNGNNTASVFTGRIDEVKIYSRAASPAEIRAEYRAGSSGIAASGISLGPLTPGNSQSHSMNTITQTDAPGYSLSIRQNRNLSTVGEVAPSKYESYASAPSGSTLSTGNTNASEFTNGGSGAPAVSSNSNPLRGNYARFSSGSGGTSYQTDLVPNEARIFGRVYLRLNSLPSNTVAIWNSYQTGVQQAHVTVSPNGELNLREGNTAIATSTTKLEAGSWVRLEPSWDRTNGVISLRIFTGGNIEGTTPNEELSGVAGSPQTSIGDIRIGISSSTSDLIADYDDVAYGTSDWLGPIGELATIPSVTGTITTPSTWAEGSTKGLGFTLTSTNATALPTKWSSGDSYAALPNSDTTFYSRSGYSGGVKDILGLRLRLDTQASQPAGDYSNQMLITGTMLP